MKLLVLLPILGLFLCPSAHAQWLSSPAPAGDGLDHIFFTSTQTGYVTSEQGHVYKTMDGGQTWTEKYHPGQLTGFEAYIFNDIFFFSDQVGYLVGIDFWALDYLILRTGDGGQTWSPFTQEFGFDIGECNQVDFPTASTGYVASDFGRLFKTTNGGGSWQVLNTPGGQNDRLLDLDFVNAQTGFLVDHDHKLYKTTNAGASWQTITLQPSFREIQFFSATNGFANADNGLYKTSDGGLTWAMVGQPIASGLGNMTFTDPNTGFAFFDGGMQKTVDGGNHWFLQEMNLGLPPNSNAGPREFFYLNDQTGWLCGYQEINGNLKALMGKTGNGGGIGLNLSVLNESVDCSGGSADATANVLGNAVAVKWYLDDVFMFADAGLKTFNNLTSGSHQIRVEASSGPNTVTQSAQLIVYPPPDFSSFSQFSISQQPCSGEAAQVYTNWNNPYESKLMIFKNNVFVDTAEVYLGAFGTGFFALPPVTTNTTFQLWAAYHCGDVKVAEITVQPRTLPITTYDLATPKSVYCGKPAEVLITMYGSQPGVLYQLFQNGYGHGNLQGTGGSLTFQAEPFAQSAIFKVYAFNGCPAFMQDSLVVRIEETDARFAVNGLNLPVGTPVEVNFAGLDAASYQWSFGQQATPATSAQQAPGTITYSGNVTTAIQLITTGPLGCRDTVVKPIALYTPADIGEYWAQEMDASNQSAYAGNSVAVDQAGNIAVSGLMVRPAVLPSRAGTGAAVSPGYGIFKYDRYGVLQWKLEHENKSMRNADLTFDQEGNVIGLYTTEGLQVTDYMYFGSTDEQRRKVLRYWSPFVIKWNPEGKLLWIAEMKICNESGMSGISVQTDAQNNIYVLGEPTFDPFYCNNLPTTFISADSSSFTRLTRHHFLAKLSPDGVFQSVLSLEDTAGHATVFAKAFGVDAHGNVLVGGEVGRLLVKYDPSGQLLWHLTPDPQTPDPYFTLWHLAVDAEGNTYINGQFRGWLKFGNVQIYSAFGPGDWDHFVMKVSPDGEVLWAKSGETDGYLITSGIRLFGGKVYLGFNFTNNYTMESLSINTTDVTRQGAVWLQLSAQNGNLERYAALVEPNPVGNYLYYGNIGNSIALDQTGNLHLLGQNGYRATWAGTLLETPNYLFLAKIPELPDIVATRELSAKSAFQAVISPNPSAEAAALLLDLPDAQTLSCYCINAQGQSLPVFEHRAMPAGRTHWMLEDLPTGVYFLDIRNDQGARTVLKWIVSP